ncbi:hypothetical Protein YC6258_02416 [Gynuella sunshinyii YC6258]|uniref:Uncharacterized protein n=1 Tax=Gynuella sunshinyii YC6258 TaxID=1445510 RepID=A0A0C5VVG4_9GAMM|nr:hypothetical Protein YC6258_02416 [Gynuella sunshinyii YC6258]
MATKTIARQRVGTSIKTREFVVGRLTVSKLFQSHRSENDKAEAFSLREHIGDIHPIPGQI